MKEKKERVTFKVDLDRDFDGNINLYVFDRTGKLKETAPVKSGTAKLKLTEKEIRSSRVYIAPEIPDNQDRKPSISLMNQLKAYEPVINTGLREGLQNTIRVPESIVTDWFLCICWVRGRVLRRSDDRAICGARVHICEVDRFPRFILRLPDEDIFRIREDLIEAIRPRPIPDPPPFEIPNDLPFKFANPSINVGFDPQPEPPLSFRGRNIQASSLAQNLRTPINLSDNLAASLNSPSAEILKKTLAHNYLEILPYLCWWPWLWYRYRCDEIRVVETDSTGRFENLIFYSCNGDKPDLYFWVEYQFGSNWDTIYRPIIPCNTYWNYECGTEVVIKVNDPRVPACDDTPDLTDLRVAVISIGNNVSIGEIQGAGYALGEEGLTTGGAPFGASLEPHVWFSRTNLFAKGITKYRWSYRRLSGPDGVTPDVGTWTVMNKEVGRHYSAIDPVTNDLTFPFEVLGPNASNLTKIQPLAPADPNATVDGWFATDARADTATAFFETTKLPHGLPGNPSACDQALITAGRYEIKLELFKDDGTMITDWESEGIDLEIATTPAPFGDATVETDPASSYYRIDNGSGKTAGFRMVLRVDNNCCRAEVLPISGPDLSVDVNCGFIEYKAGAVANVGFIAAHPNNFATFNFNTYRGLGIHVPEASTGGKVGDPSTASLGGPFTGTGFNYAKNVAVSTLLTSNTPSGSTFCDRAAFAERLKVKTMATDGWTRLHYLDHSDIAAFALDIPCEPCDCFDEQNTEEF